jgi:hypothetical protein
MFDTKGAFYLFHELELHVDSRPYVYHMDSPLVDLCLGGLEAFARFHENISVSEEESVSDRATHSVLIDHNNDLLQTDFYQGYDTHN